MILRHLLSGTIRLLAIACILTAASAALAAPVPEPGDRGTVLTVFQGSEIEEVPARFLGVLHQALGPGVDLYLIELEGELAAETGIVAGMSGSPVYFDGSLLGALAYRLGAFPKRAVGGVVPIAAIKAAATATTAAAATGEKVEPIGTPLVISGMAQPLKEWLLPQLAASGIASTAGGGIAPSMSPSELQAGSPVGVELVGGDMHLAATGTVTLVEGDTVYAFGHSFLGTGGVAYPLVSAEVVHTLRDQSGSSKLSNIGPALGTVFDDRLTAVVGRLGVRARTIPVDVEIVDEASGPRTLHYEIAEHPTLTPVLFGAAVSSGLLGSVAFETDATVVARGSIGIESLPDLPVELAFTSGSGPHPLVSAAVRFQALVQSVYTNRFTEPRITGVKIRMEVSPGRRSYRTERLLHDRSPLEAGEELVVRCVLSGERSGETRRELRLQVPASAVPGTRLLLLVGGQSEIERAMGRPLASRLAGAVDLATYVKILSETRPENRLRAVLVRSDSGAAIARGGAWNELPPTVTHLLADGKNGGSRNRVRVTVLAETELVVDGPVRGMRTARFTVRRSAGKKGER